MAFESSFINSIPHALTGASLYSLFFNSDISTYQVLVVCMCERIYVLSSKCTSANLDKRLRPNWIESIPSEWTNLTFQP